MGKKTPRIEIVPTCIRLTAFPQGSFRKSSFLSVGARTKNCTLEEVLKYGEESEWRSGRGRKYGSGEIPPQLIVGRVDTLTDERKAKNREEAFRKVADETGYGYDNVKKIYYTAPKSVAYRPRVEYGEEKAILNAEEHKKYCEMLKQGMIHQEILKKLGK